MRVSHKDQLAELRQEYSQLLDQRDQLQATKDALAQALRAVTEYAKTAQWCLFLDMHMDRADLQDMWIALEEARAALLAAGLEE